MRQTKARPTTPAHRALQIEGIAREIAQLILLNPDSAEMSKALDLLKSTTSMLPPVIIQTAALTLGNPNEWQPHQLQRAFLRLGKCYLPVRPSLNEGFSALADLAKAAEKANPDSLEVRLLREKLDLPSASGPN
jgi:hypothetical protein